MYILDSNTNDANEIKELAIEIICRGWSWKAGSSAQYVVVINAQAGWCTYVHMHDDDVVAVPVCASPQPLLSYALVMTCMYTALLLAYSIVIMVAENVRSHLFSDTIRGGNSMFCNHPVQCVVRSEVM